MEQRKYDNCIVLDGRLNEPIWETAKEYSDFKTLQSRGSKPADLKTSFKILTFEDRIYIGVYCQEPYMEAVLKGSAFRSIWTNDTIELFLSPAGNAFEFYQFAMSIVGQTSCQFYSEKGVIRPDPYAPDWHHAVYAGEDFWSVEIELPLTAFYMTSNDVWSERWKFNLCRGRNNYVKGGTSDWSWSDLVSKYLEPENFGELDGFPVRPACNDLRISSAAVQIDEENARGFCGMMTVKATVPETKIFAFSAENAEAVTLELTAGFNEFTVPCCFKERKRYWIPMQLKRLEDGMEFKRRYPAKIDYEPIRLELTLPEYRGNFYPGQDYSVVAGKVIAAKPATVRLEGAGIVPQTVIAGEDGSFRFDTPDFAVGEAVLTVTIEGHELQKKIRRLAPSGHTMSWISGGNLIVNGKPVLRRNIDAIYYRGGKAFDRKYDADSLHETKEFVSQSGLLQPDFILKGLNMPIGEVTTDVRPNDVVFEAIDKVLEANKDREFVYYYLSDEPECRGLSPVYLQYLYDYIAEKDPYHIIEVCSRSARNFINCSDWIEVHPYIDAQNRPGKPRYFSRPFHTLRDFVEEVSRLNRNDKCIGFLPTCFAYKWSNIYADYPNFVELVCHSWAGMIPGSKSIWAYAYHDLNDRPALYEGMRYVFSSMEALDKLILFAKRTELVRSNDVHAMLYELADEKVFVLVNLSMQPQQVILEGISGTWHEFRHNRTFTGNTFALKPFEVLIGTTEIKDTGLPTYEETTALIDKLEYDRTHRGSLLFDRHLDIPVTSSGGKGTYYKLFDGMLDNHAWEQSGDMEKFYELDLTKVKPAFRKVVVYGYSVDDAELKVRNGGELSVPAIVDIQTEEFSKTFILKDTISPEGLRFEFHARKVELYEIEVF